MVQIPVCVLRETFPWGGLSGVEMADVAQA